MAPLTQQLFRRKPLPEMTAGTGDDSNSSELVCGIGLFQRSMFGIGSTIGIGIGIFFVLSQAKVVGRRDGQPVRVPAPRHRPGPGARGLGPDRVMAQ
jgi:hypothetical protein